MITLFLSSFSVSVKALRSESKCFAQPETCDDLASSCDLQPNSAADYFMVMQVIALTNEWSNGSTDLTINHKSHHNCVSAHDDPTVIKSHSKLFVNIYNTLWWHLGHVTQQPFLPAYEHCLEWPSILQFVPGYIYCHSSNFCSSFTSNLAKCDFGKAFVTDLGKQIGCGQVCP